MKKTTFVIALILVLSLVAVGSVSAKKGKINVKGEVTEVGAGTLTIVSHKGEIFVVTVPEGFDISSIAVGDSVFVKAVADENGAWHAETIKKFDAGNDEDKEKETKDKENYVEGDKDNSAFCADDKQEKLHPLAAKLSERYGVTGEWVMGYICDGYSVGAIMLALKTSEMDGIDSDPADLLAGRADGDAWGNIWKELGLIGNEKEGHSPPGLLKKPLKDK